jgi:hypothetical protein
MSDDRLVVRERHVVRLHRPARQQGRVPTGGERNGSTENPTAAVLQRPGLQFVFLPQDTKSRIDNKKKRHVVVARGDPVSQPR